MPAFRTLPHAGHVYLAVGFTYFGASQVANRLSLPGSEQGRAFDNAAWRLLAGVFIGLIWALVVTSAVHVFAVWRDIGVQLRPDGLVHRGLLGTLTAPWEALAPGYPLPTPPAATSLALTYAGPELVRRRGLLQRRILTDNVNALFLGYAIRYYLAYPQRRSMIGSQTEYDNLIRSAHSGVLPVVPGQV
jgi:hypothetical protein